MVAGEEEMTMTITQPSKEAMEGVVVEVRGDGVGGQVGQLQGA
jgi:uncharacterized protein (UPF0179 family)